MNNKPFDLQKALAGEPVVNRRGHKVSEIFFSQTRKEAGTRPLIAVYETTGNISHNWDDDGVADVEHELGDSNDLFMAPVKKTVWVNMWYCNSGVIMSSPEPFATKELALDRDIVKRPYYLGTYPIEIEL